MAVSVWDLIPRDVESRVHKAMHQARYLLDR